MVRKHWQAPTTTIGSFCALLACLTFPLAHAAAASPPDLDSVLRQNAAALGKYRSIRYAISTATWSRDTAVRGAVAHVTLHNGADHVKRMLQMPGAMGETVSAVRNHRYFAFWKTGMSGIQQYELTPRGKLPRTAEPFADLAMPPDEQVLLRICGNGSRSLGEARADPQQSSFVWSCEQREDGLIVVRATVGRPMTMEYLIDPARDHLIVAQSSQWGDGMSFRGIHTLVEISPGVWFPSKMQEELTDRRGLCNQTINVISEVEMNPAVTPVDFELGAMQVPAETAVNVISLAGEIRRHIRVGDGYVPMDPATGEAAAGHAPVADPIATVTDPQAWPWVWLMGLGAVVAVICATWFARHTISLRRRRGVLAAFTLVELLVVIGIIGLLIAILLPTIATARSKARATTCAANLRVIGQAFGTYALENGGAWPVVIWYFPPPGVPDGPSTRTRVRRWFDEISSQVGPSLNPTGDAEEDYQTVRDNSVLWGCPEWRPDLGGRGPGYAMNNNPLSRPDSWGMYVSDDGGMGWAIIAFDPNGDGQFYRQTQWAAPTEKGLVYESHTLGGPLGTGDLGTWPWWPDPDASMPSKPIGGYTLDFARHAGPRVGENRPSTNVLFVDGHVAMLSPKQAHYAMSFSPGAAP
jgi:prepilin-type processing-associated H-X9-DG protein